MNKSFNASPQEAGEISSQDLELINKYSQKELKSGEIFTFSVILCDNEIDRDFERFTVDSLKTLAKLFVGKTAIKNHSMNSDDQMARTYKTEVVADPEKRNSLGEQYVYLKAYCYMPRIEKNADFIEEIRSGIKKEVSVGCAVGGNICSICGIDLKKRVCSHKKGGVYKGKLCYSELINPTDAYEWSFVAVPAQRNAGVVKSFSQREVKNLNDVIKALSLAKEDVTLEKNKAREIAEYVSRLERQASDGREYRKSLESDTVRLFAITMPSVPNECTESIVKSLRTEDLKQLMSALDEKKKDKVGAPTLYREKEKSAEDKISQFKF